MLLRWIKDSTSKLRKVFPFPSGNNVAYATLGDSEHFRQHCRADYMRDVEASDFYDLRLRQDCGVALLPAQVPLPAFFNHVLHIVFLGSSKKVIRVAAGRVIAFVKNVESVRYLTIRNDPRQPVGKHPDSFWLCVQGNDSIALDESTANEGPAFIRPIPLYVGPHPISERHQLDFSPPRKSRSIFNGNVLDFLVWVFEFHAVGNLIESRRASQC